MSFRVERNKHIAQAPVQVPGSPMAMDGLSDKSLVQQALIEHVGVFGRVKAKPFGWPPASLDPPKHQCACAVADSQAGASRHL